MADILERLRRIAEDDDVDLTHTQSAYDAADEIRRLRLALAGYGRDPESCTEGGPCVSHMAYLEAEAEIGRLRAERDRLARELDEANAELREQDQEIRHLEDD